MDAPGVGVAAIVVAEGRVLLVRRARPPARGQWSFPGGRVHLGERLQDALRREVREECGLEVAVGRLFEVAEVLLDEDGERFHWVVLDYLARPLGGRLAAGDDAAEARWVAAAELPQLAVPPLVAELARRALAAGEGS